jgi:hypothetical protein
MSRSTATPGPARSPAYLVAAVLVAAVLSPLLRDPTGDDYPLSTYPMFARPRPAVVAIPRAVVIDDDGSERRLTPHDLGTDEVVGALGMLRTAIAGGPGTLDVLCRSVADRQLGTAAIEVVIVDETFDAVAWFRGDLGPLERKELSRCPVEGPVDEPSDGPGEVAS